MDTYSWIKSILMAIAIVAAFGIFFARVKQLFLLMRSVSGDAGLKLDRVGERVKVLVTDVLGQSNVRRKPLAGWAHTLIFFGFLAVQPHSLELMIQGVFPAFHLAFLSAALYGAYLFAADILAFPVLVGLGYALYRRLSSSSPFTLSTPFSFCPPWAAAGLIMAAISPFQRWSATGLI
jgi:hypothetical protein